VSAIIYSREGQIPELADGTANVRVIDNDFGIASSVKGSVRGQLSRNRKRYSLPPKPVAGIVSIAVDEGYPDVARKKVGQSGYLGASAFVASCTIC
jgi:hypothetical protein